MTVICKTCKYPKNETEYYSSKNKSGHESSCKTCSDLRHYERRRAKRIANGLKVNFPTIVSRQLLAEGMKFCPRCKQILPLDDFSTMKVRSGIASHCKECSNQIARELNSTFERKMIRQQKYKRNREKSINDKLVRKFGLTYDEYKIKLESQNGVCSICGKSPEQNKKLLAVDHNHVTGKIRGILCSSCNICIGFIEKNNLDFNKIKEYLNQHNITNS